MTHPWLLPLRSSTTAEHRLVWFPHAGGGANFFRPWTGLVDPQLEVLAAVYPGREHRLADPMIADAAAAVAKLAAELDEVAADGRPTILFGHSMGALLAYETARVLARRPAHLVVSGRSSPTCDTPWNGPRSDAEILRRVRAHGETSEEVLAEPGLRDMVLDILRNDYHLVDAYRMLPGPLPDVDITALGGIDDPDVTPAGLAAWRDATTGSFRHRMFPGGHFYLSDQRTTVVALLQQLVGVSIA